MVLDKIGSTKMYTNETWIQAVEHSWQQKLFWKFFPVKEHHYYLKDSGPAETYSKCQFKTYGATV